MTGGKEMEYYHLFTILFAGFIPTTSFLELPGATSTGMLQSVYTSPCTRTGLHYTLNRARYYILKFAQILWDQMHMENTSKPYWFFIPCSTRDICTMSRLTPSTCCGSSHHSCQCPAASDQFGHFHRELCCLDESQEEQTGPGQEPLHWTCRSHLWCSG